MDLEGFARRLDELRGERSVNSFAQSCGLAESTLRNYLSARTVPRADAVMAISSATGARLEWLMTGAPAAGEAVQSRGSDLGDEALRGELAAARAEVARLRAELEARARSAADVDQEEARLLRRIALEEVRLAKPGSPEAAWRILSTLYASHHEPRGLTRVVSELRERGIEASVEDVRAELDVLVGSGLLAKSGNADDPLFSVPARGQEVLGDGPVVSQHAREAIRQILRVIVPARSVSRNRGRIITYVTKVSKADSEAYLARVVDQLQQSVYQGEVPEQDFDRFTLVLGVALDERLPGGMT